MFTASTRCFELIHQKVLQACLTNSFVCSSIIAYMSLGNYAAYREGTYSISDAKYMFLRCNVKESIII